MAQIQIELTAEKANGNGYFYASLDLPATKMQIENAKQEARYTDSDTSSMASMLQPTPMNVPKFMTESIFRRRKNLKTLCSDCLYQTLPWRIRVRC